MMLLILFLTFSASLGDIAENTMVYHPESTPPSHQIWQELLQEHVDELGGVDYKGFVRDSNQLNSYLQTLSENPPQKLKWSKQEQMAFWINAYNAYTVKIIADNYPVKSIKDIGPKRAIPFINTTWDIKFITIGKENLDLNKIEHKKLRKQFRDPRIHFAIVCASYSCPRLLNEAFTASNLDEQLNMMARDFLEDTRKNRITASKLELSKIFNWYKGDFLDKKIKSLPQYLNQFSKVKIDEEAEIEWLDYDWSLNEQK